MPRPKRPEEPSSDASLWNDLDDADRTFAEISTPPLPPSDRCKLDIGSPIVGTDRSNSTSHHGLEPELVPTGRPQGNPSSCSSLSQPLQPPSSFDLGAVGVGEPWSQLEVRTTQHQRDEWLISVGQKEPTDLVEDHIPLVGKAERTTAPTLPSHLAFKTAQATAMETVSAAVPALAPAAAATPTCESPRIFRAHAGIPAHPTAPQKRSSLLDQLDEICGSSPSDPGKTPRAEYRQRSSQESATEHVGSARLKTSNPSAPFEKVPGPSWPVTIAEGKGESPTVIDLDVDEGMDATFEDADQAGHDRPPLRPSISARANGGTTSIDDVFDEFSAHDMFDISSSPPSQPNSRITLIKDMPPEKQEIYRRLAFGNSASNNFNNIGTTVRGRSGKTWQTTWQGNVDSVDASDVRAGASDSNTNRADGSRSAMAIGRGHNSTGSTGVARRGARGGKARSGNSSGSAADRGRSRFFGSRTARGARRGRGRAR